jgi:hypothetical protein
MDLTAKIKMALDETRMLVLGCQVLLGFQFQLVFQHGFVDLPETAKAAAAAALLLMILALGFLILPSAYHMTVEGRRATRRIAKLVTNCTRLALWPFAIALGLDLGVALERIHGAAAGIAAALVFSALALVLWLGIGMAARQSHGAKERAMAEMQQERSTSLSDQIDFMLTEARTILPGVQALLGFQLVVVFTAAFDRLPLYAKSVHAAALAMVACSVVLLMAPAAYHRIVHAGEASAHFLKVGSRMVMAATLPLALGIAADAFVTIDAIFDSPRAGVIAGAGALVALTGLWYAYPIAARWSGIAPRGSTDAREA